MSDQAIIIEFFDYPIRNGLQDLHDFENHLSVAISESRSGEFDGDEVAIDGSSGTLFLYGPDAEKLFLAIEALLRASPLMKGARVVLRFGPPANDTRWRAISIP